MPPIKRAISEVNFASAPDWRVDRDSADTKVPCPQCAHCSLCGGHQLVCAEERAAYMQMNSAREPCPRCDRFEPSRICPLCEGRYRVPPTVRVLWELQHGQKPKDKT